MSNIKFRVGDIVSRDGRDRQRVLEFNDGGDLMLVECIQEPPGWLNDDGTREEPWCKLGDTEWNTISRYDFADEAIEMPTTLKTIGR